MKKFLLIICLSFLSYSCASSSQQEQENVVDGFVNGSEDIPLLRGLTQIGDDDLGFDSGIGSISTTNYKSDFDLEKAKRFYLKTLPQMGWNLSEKKLEKISFFRGNEKVEISFVNKDGDDLVQFFISSTL